MQPMFDTLLSIMKKPLRPDRGVKTDNSILLIYPQGKELEFRGQLLDCFLPTLKAQGITFETIDLTDFMFDNLSEDEVKEFQEDEFDDYQWMIQGLSKRMDELLRARVNELSQKSKKENIIIYNTAALFPMVRFGELLVGLRDLGCRIALAFPGEEKGGKLHFMNQADGGNYLAVKLSWN